MGARMLRDQLDRAGIKVGRRRVGTLMKRMGIEALYRRSNWQRNYWQRFHLKIKKSCSDKWSHLSIGFAGGL